MIVELVVGPVAEGVRSDLAESPGWAAYAAGLRSVLEAVFAATGVAGLEVSQLLVDRPLQKRLAGLRNGSAVDAPEAVELAVGMAAGDGPYCRLSVPDRLRLESGWDGSVHLYLTPEGAAGLSGLAADEVQLERREAAVEPPDATEPVTSAADNGFWSGVRGSVAETTLLSERWAYGAHGSRWFRVTGENLGEIARSVGPRSLLRVFADPNLRLRPELHDEDFTAFRTPLEPGELSYRAFPGGVDDLAVVTDQGFSSMLPDSAPSLWSAVVPDADGVVRSDWDRTAAT